MMNYRDHRGKRVLYVGNCLLNQNVRGFGVAVANGAFAEFIQIPLSRGIGIEQLPCPECLAWGGIGRTSLYKWQPIMFNSTERWWYPVLQFMVKINFYLTHRRQCRRQAKRAVAWMEDHIKQGYEVVGVVLANDSPTCGVTKTVVLFDVIKQAKLQGMTLDDFENPRVEKIGPFTQSILADGAGALGGAIKEELRKRKLDIDVIGWDLWEDPAQEADRIARLLDLKT